MRIGNITDIGFIVDLYREYYSPEELKGIEFYLSFKIRNTFEIQFFLNESNTILIVVERMGNFKCQLHFYTKKESRGKETKELFQQVIDYLKGHSNYTSFVTFIPSDNRVAKVAAKYVGFKEGITLQDAGGEGKDECLFILGDI